MRLLSRRRHRVSEAERRARFGLLLLALGATFLCQGILPPGRADQLISSVLLAVTLVLALRCAEARREVMWVAYVVAGLLAGLGGGAAIFGDPGGVAPRVANLLLILVAPAAVVAGTRRSLRVRSQVTVEAVMGVLCLYLLLGLFFAFVYGLIGRIDGTFFAHDVPVTTARCLYFSFTTLTTVGYGDYTAASNLGHTLSVSEALVGQIYLVTVVSLIVGNLGRGRMTDIRGERSSSLSGD